MGRARTNPVPNDTPTEPPHLDRLGPTIRLEDIISNMDLTKEQKEEFYLRILEQDAGVSPEDGKVLWEDDKIKGFQLYANIEHVDVTVTISEDGIDVK
jgi:hypothetical protein